MKRVKFFYNTGTGKYEKLSTPFRVRLLQVFGFLAALLFTSYILLTLTHRFFPSNREARLSAENQRLNYALKIMDKHVNELDDRMTSIEARDNTVYRAIFESDPVPDSIRVRKQEELLEMRELATMNEPQLVQDIIKTLKTLGGRIDYQQKSFVQIEKMVEEKEKLLAATPSIQPVSNKQLERIASGFGYRIDPIYKIPKLHQGLDFTANTGTPIYATADGTVKLAAFAVTGYGNHVIINHGYGYETLYGHMVRIKVRNGEKVSRGSVIGWVGSTGKSTGPHVHYEVRRSGTAVDPVYYFYNDLNAEEYDRLLKLAATKNQSFD